MYGYANEKTYPTSPMPTRSVTPLRTWNATPIHYPMSVTEHRLAQDMKYNSDPPPDATTDNSRGHVVRSGRALGLSETPTRRVVDSHGGDSRHSNPARSVTPARTMTSFRTITPTRTVTCGPARPVTPFRSESSEATWGAVRPSEYSSSITDRAGGKGELSGWGVEPVRRASNVPAARATDNCTDVVCSNSDSRPVSGEAWTPRPMTGPPTVYTGRPLTPPPPSSAESGYITVSTTNMSPFLVLRIKALIELVSIESDPSPSTTRIVTSGPSGGLKSCLKARDSESRGEDSLKARENFDEQNVVLLNNLLEENKRGLLPQRPSLQEVNYRFNNTFVSSRQNGKMTKLAFSPGATLICFDSSEKPRRIRDNHAKHFSEFLLSQIQQGSR